MLEDIKFTLDQTFKVIVVNRALSSLHGGLLEILKKSYFCIIVSA